MTVIERERRGRRDRAERRQLTALAAARSRAEVERTRARLGLLDDKLV